MKRQHALMVGARMPLLITLFADYYDASYNCLMFAKISQNTKSNYIYDRV